MRNGQDAESFIKSRSSSFGIEPKTFENKDIHVRARRSNSKDGPSAGVAMVTSIVSRADGDTGEKERCHDGRNNARGVFYQLVV